MRVGLLEFRNNDFIASIAEELKGFDVEFVSIAELHHPSPCPYRLVVDRVSFADPYLREVMRYWSLSGAYVLNNPFYTLIADKLSDLRVCDRLGIPYPRTILLPRANLSEDMRELVSEPSWDRIHEGMHFPCIVKPVDGYAWQDVFRADSLEDLMRLYESLKEKRVLMVQELVSWSRYYRAFCVGSGDVLLVQWTPKPLDMGEYAALEASENPELTGFMTRKSAEFNAAVGLDFNSVEWCVTADGKAYIIDSYNDVPDVRRDKLPDSCYRWIVEKLCSRAKGILESGEKNVFPLL
jgi:hypothetical protein